MNLVGLLGLSLCSSVHQSSNSLLHQFFLFVLDVVETITNGGPHPSGDHVTPWLMGPWLLSKADLICSDSGTYWKLVNEHIHLIFVCWWFSFDADARSVSKKLMGWLFYNINIPNKAHPEREDTATIVCVCDICELDSLVWYKAMPITSSICYSLSTVVSFLFPL